MSFIEPRTVMLLAEIMSGLMALVLYRIKCSYPPSIRGIGQWSAGFLLIFIGGLLFAAHPHLPNLLTFPIPNLLIWLGLYLIYVGGQHFFGVTPRHGPWLIVFSAGLLVMIWISMMQPNYHARLVCASVLRALPMAALAWLIARQGINTFSRALALSVLLGSMASHVLRIISSFLRPMNGSTFDTDPLALMHVSSSTFLILLLSISLVLLASERLRTELEHLAHYDPLTNALNRRQMNHICATELERSRRHSRNMALLMLDLDHFKAINDTYGHQAGDQVLVNFTQQVSALLRQADQLGRFGGEEFVVLLPETSLDEALLVAGRILRVCVRHEHTPSCTVSIGVTTNQSEHDTVDKLLGRADAAMYQAKSNGRNQAVSL